MAGTDGLDAHEDRLDEYARRWIDQATRFAGYDCVKQADDMIRYAQEWSQLEDAGAVLRSVLDAIRRHREPASCITAEDRMSAMIAEIQGAFEPIARAAVEYADSLGEYGGDV
jgi:hypothetical protein